MKPLTVRQRLRGLHAMVGNTPLLAIACEVDGRPRTVFAKAEFLNLTGSIKDRMALHLILDAYRSGALNPGDRIVEATSGNTGISFAAIGRALGHPVTVIMPDWLSEERRMLIRGFGAEVRLVSEAAGGFQECIRLAEQFASVRKHVFLPRQFENPANVSAHETTTGPEIWSQLAAVGQTPGAFVAGVGTGGTVMGVGRFFRSRDPGIRVHPVEPASSPILTAGHKVGHHRIQGISDEFIPPVVRLDELGRVLQVHDGDAILMAQRLAADLGLGVGISAGANFLAALMAAEDLGPDAAVATVLPDSNKKYLSTDLMGTEPVRRDYLSRRVRLVSFEALPRVCTVCLVPRPAEDEILIALSGSVYR
ncbi:MAG TPA: cysteine synthase family protein [Gemmatimonadales bacterium]|nr:cysteine synthase family protein [Gemmatimonadales bacterium]